MGTSQECRPGSDALNIMIREFVFEYEVQSQALEADPDAELQSDVHAAGASNRVMSKYYKLHHLDHH